MGSGTTNLTCLKTKPEINWKIKRKNNIVTVHRTSEILPLTADEYTQAKEKT